MLSKSQSIHDNSGVVVVNIEELQVKKLEGGQSSALINLEETEDIDAYFPDEVCFLITLVGIQNKLYLRAHSHKEVTSCYTSCNHEREVNYIQLFNPSSIAHGLYVFI